uniref:Reverse transcriptase Ty1/copia-type domain-containing protein n=1 Tax=Cannabis sativa TaxID=3483 RepID=A0A803P6J4_CANSA
MPLTFWWEAYAAAAYLINRLPTQILQHMAPFEKLYNHKPDYNLLKVFWCSCFPLLTPYNHHKVTFRSSKFLFLGYNNTQKGYRCLHPSGKIYVARSVTFNEAEFPYHELFPSNISSVPTPSITPIQGFPIPQHTPNNNNYRVNTPTNSSHDYNAYVQTPHSHYPSTPHTATSSSQYTSTDSSLPYPLPPQSPSLTQPVSDQPPTSTRDNTHPMIRSTIQALHNKFALKILGSVHYFLGFEVLRDDKAIYLTQTKYIHDLLTKTNMLDAKPQTTPMCANIKLSQTSGTPLTDPKQYRSVIGAFQYVLMTRPDIAFAVNKLSQYLQHPTTDHWGACKRILRYLAGTSTTGLTFTAASSLQLQGYSDADWAGCSDDKKSTSGYCMFMGNNLISWCSKKQRNNLISSTSFLPCKHCDIL